MKTNKRPVSCFAVIVAALASGPASAAFFYQATTTTTTGRNTDTTRVQAWIDGPKARVEFVEVGAQGALFPAGSYIVTMDGGATLHLVNPTEMTFMPLDLDALLGFAGAMLNAAEGVVEMEFSDFVNETLSEGPGEPLLGYDTTRHEYRTSYTMSIGVLGFTRATTVETQSEVWCTDTLDAEGFRVWLRPDRFRTGNAEIDELIEQQYAGIDCMPLRMRSTSTNTGQRGRESSSTSLTEVTSIEEQASVDPTQFEVPAGFAETALIPELPLGEVPPDGDAPADDAADPAQEEPSGQRPRIRLRDLIGR